MNEIIEVETRVVPASREALVRFSWKNLRGYASDLGVEVGQSKEDAIKNILDSGKATICGSLGN